MKDSGITFIELGKRLGVSAASARHIYWRALRETNRKRYRLEKGALGKKAYERRAHEQEFIYAKKYGKLYDPPQFVDHWPNPRSMPAWSHWIVSWPKEIRIFIRRPHARSNEFPAFTFTVGLIACGGFDPHVLRRGDVAVAIRAARKKMKEIVIGWQTVA